MIEGKMIGEERIGVETRRFILRILPSFCRAIILPNRFSVLFFASVWGCVSPGTQPSLGRGGEDAAKPGPGPEADEAGRTALHRAAEQGDARQVAALLAGGADVKARDGHGNTPLHLAARAGRRRAAELLIGEGADVKATTFCKYTPLHLAAWSGDVRTIRLLLAKGADPKAQDYDNRTPLHYASTRPAVGLLLAAGVEVDVRYVPWARTPLLDAAMHGFPEAAAALLDHGANLQATNCSHFTPLHWAAWGGHANVVKLLLARGADVYYEDDSGYTPLLWTEYWGHHAVLKLLKSKMATMPRTSNPQR